MAMLILNRQQGEKILIGDDIKVTILGNQGIVRVGIDAPKNIRILREELRNCNPYRNQRIAKCTHGS